MKRIYVVWLFCAHLFVAYAQPSFEKIKEDLESQTISDKDWLSAYLRLPDEYFLKFHHTFLHHKDKAIKLISNKNDNYLLASTYLYLSIAYSEQSNYVEALEYIKKGKVFAENLSNNHIKALGYYATSILYFHKKEYDLYFKNADYALNILGDKSILSYRLYRKKGIIYSRLSEDGKAFEYFHKALKLSLELNIVNEIASDYNNLALMLYSNENFEKAIDYFEKCIEKAKLYGNDNSITFINMALVYINLEEYEKAIVHLNQALKDSEKHKRRETLSSIYTLFGTVYYRMENYDTAKQNYLKAIQYNKEDNDPPNELVDYISNITIKSCNYFLTGEKTDPAYFDKLLANSSQQNYVATASREVGEHYIKTTKNYQKAIPFLEKARLIEKKNNYSKELQSTLELLSECYYNTKQYKKAHDLKMQEVKIADSLEIISDKNDLNTRMLIFDFEQEKEKSNTQLAVQNLTIQKQKNELLSQQYFITLVLSIFIISALITIFYRSKMIQRQRRKINEAMLKIEKSRVEAIIEGGEKEKKRIAHHIHESLSQDLIAIGQGYSLLIKDYIDDLNHKKFINISEALDKSIQDLRALSYELVPPELGIMTVVYAIESYCESSSKKHNIKIDFKYEGESLNLSLNKETALYRVIQELVKNVVKHSKAKESLVKMICVDNNLNILVKDKGVGFDLNNWQEGLGWKNIAYRLKLLKAKYKIETDRNTGTSIYLNMAV